MDTNNKDENIEELTTDQEEIKQDTNVDDVIDDILDSNVSTTVSSNNGSEVKNNSAADSDFILNDVETNEKEDLKEDTQANDQKTEVKEEEKNKEESVKIENENNNQEEITKMPKSKKVPLLILLFVLLILDIAALVIYIIGIDKVFSFIK